MCSIGANSLQAALAQGSRRLALFCRLIGAVLWSDFFTANPATFNQTPVTRAFSGWHSACSLPGTRADLKVVHPAARFELVTL
jgi:hypothetical protein